MEGRGDALLVDLAGKEHLVVEAADGPGAPTEDPDALALLALAGDGQATPGHLDRQVLELDAGELDLSQVRLLGLLEVGERRERTGPGEQLVPAAQQGVELAPELGQAGRTPSC